MTHSETAIRSISLRGNLRARLPRSDASPAMRRTKNSSPRSLRVFASENNAAAHQAGERCYNASKLLARWEGWNVVARLKNIAPVQAGLLYAALYGIIGLLFA